jgi:hypothetical protein
MTRPDVQPVDRRGTGFVITAVLLAAVYQALWYVAPEFLAQPLWPGTALTVAFPLGTIAILAPAVLAWLMASKDIASTERFHSSGH